MTLLLHRRRLLTVAAAFSWILSCNAFVPIAPRQRSLLFHQKQQAPLLPTSSLQRTDTSSALALAPFVPELAQSLFRSAGTVPFWQAFGMNAFLFGILSPKLTKSLTPEGMAHAFALGTLLWTTLGVTGWSMCVVYLVAGNLVTKVKFEEKEKRGLAEGRGGRRGPENVWYVL
jgi:hypothetical protein